jgi:hypothetical protein
MPSRIHGIEIFHYEKAYRTADDHKKKGILEVIRMRRMRWSTETMDLYRKQGVLGILIIRTGYGDMYGMVGTVL